MKAEERHEIEQNSLIKYIQKARDGISGKGGYYLLGGVLFVTAAILLWRYVANERRATNDGRILQLEYASTADDLKKLVDENRGTIFGSLAKLHLARRSLGPEGLEKIGTEDREDRRLAVASIEQARSYFLELTKELKEKEEPSLVVECWLGAAKAEETLVGITDEKNDSRGNADKAIDYYTKAASIFPETEESARITKWVETLKSNKEQFIANQKLFYALREPVPPPPVPSGAGLPPLVDPKGTGIDTKVPDLKLPGVPDVKKVEPAPVTPEIKAPPTIPDSKKSDPKAPEIKKENPENKKDANKAPELKPKS